MTTTAPAGLRLVRDLPVPDLSDEGLARVTARLAELAEDHDRSARFPHDGIRIVHEAGLLTAGVGARYGGSPLSAVDAARVFLALGAGDPAVALISAMTVFQHLAQDRSPWWPEDLYRQVVATSIREPQLLNAIRAEPELGAPARGGLPATTIRRDGDRWILTGHKGFATGSEGLAYHLVWTVNPDGESGEPEIGTAVVPAGLPGIRIERTWDHLGQRATSTHDVIYDDVELPLEHFHGVPVSQAKSDVAGPASVGVIAIYIGVARAAQAAFVAFANERIPTALGRPIATTERIQSVAGEIEAQLVQAEAVLFDAARRSDAGDPRAGERAVLAKAIGTRSAIAAVQTAVAALGNPALTRHNPLERHLRDVLAARVHPPQEDAALLIAGRRTLADYPRSS
jgi:alkylation response protein AidB-like acyl-CoA dehydrogenase